MQKILKSERIYLRHLTVNDVSDAYVSWLNDKSVNQYLAGVSQTTHSFESVCEFVQNSAKKKDEYFFGIFLNDSDKHIGNIKIGYIIPHHLVGDIGILIGDKSQWGKGYAAEAIKTIANYAFNTLNLNKLTAGLYASNTSCAKAFEKAGFQKEGHRIKHYLLNGIPEDIIEYGACHDSWSKL